MQTLRTALLAAAVTQATADASLGRALSHHELRALSHSADSAPAWDGPMLKCYNNIDSGTFDSWGWRKRVRAAHASSPRAPLYRTA